MRPEARETLSEPEGTSKDRRAASLPAGAATPAAIRLRVVHVSHYGYGGPVSLGHHQARLRPRQTCRQRLESHALSVEPAPRFLHETLDWFGNHLADLSIEAPHRDLLVRATTVVALAPLRPLDPVATPPWDGESDAAFAVSGGAPGDRPDEFLQPTRLAPVHPSLRGYAEPSFPSGRPILAGALDLMHRIRADYAYDPTATTVTTPATEVLRLRRGVCQDFAHLMIACLRSLGLAARYVSGYVQSTGSAEVATLIGSEASHAWVSLHVPGPGWVDLDPTNGRVPDRQHVTVGWGRDYTDVAPLKGIVLGGASQTLSVSVDVSCLG